MATGSGKEIEIAQTPTRLTDATRGGFVQNMWTRNGTRQVRPGFGQLCQLDTTLALPPAAADGRLDNQTFGFQEVLGLHALRTIFGHEQLLAVVSWQAYDGEGYDRASSGRGPGAFGRGMSLVVYDVATGRWLESPLARHTSEQPANNMEFARGAFQTISTERFIDPVQSPTALRYDEQPETPDDYGLWFCRSGDVVLFGAPKVGAWAYRPIDIAMHAWRQAQTLHTNNTIAGRGEDAWCIPVVPLPGIFRGRYSYLTAGTFPTSPTACARVGLRSAFSQGREVFISDVDRPGCVMAVNVLGVPCDTDITALVAVSGVLLIFTKRQTWTFNPADGANVAAGDLRMLSASVGCAGPQAVIARESSAVWIDDSGVWTSSGMSAPAMLSEAIKPFFNDYMSLPLSSFYQNAGVTAGTSPQPRIAVRGGDWRGASLCFLEDADAVIVNVPSQGVALVLQEGAWSVWSFETVVNDTEDAVVATQLGAPRLAALGERLFMAAGMDHATPDDQTVEGGTGGRQNHNNEARSFWLGELGRGGSLDRTVDVAEDNRVWQGWYEREDNSGTALWVIDRPALLPDGYCPSDGTDRLPGIPDSPITDTQPVYLFPVYLLSGSLSPDVAVLEFDFDNTQWTPVFRGATPEVLFDLPPERGASRAGWGMGAPALATEVRCYNGGVPDQAGNQIRMHFAGALGAWTHAPYLNTSWLARSPVMYLPFRKKTLTVSDNAMSLGIELVAASVSDTGAPVTALADLVWWHHAFISPASRNTADQTAQAVDWVLRSDLLGEDGALQVRARNVFARVVASGDADVPIHAWTRRTFNATMAPDHKEWSSQLVDHSDGAVTLDSHAPLRSRFMVAPDAVPSQTVADSPATTPPKWGDAAHPGDGNLLAADPALDTAIISDRARGEFVSVTLWGHMLNIGEWLRVKSAKVAMQVVAGRRRRGR